MPNVFGVNDGPCGYRSGVIESLNLASAVNMCALVVSVTGFLLYEGDRQFDILPYQRIYVISECFCRRRGSISRKYEIFNRLAWSARLLQEAQGIRKKTSIKMVKPTLSYEIIFKYMDIKFQKIK